MTEVILNGNLLCALMAVYGCLIGAKTILLQSCRSCVLFFFFFSIGAFFHEHSWLTGLQGKGEGISLTPHCYFHPLHRHLDISRAIAAESSPLHIASNRTRTGKLWFPSASCYPLLYRCLKNVIYQIDSNGWLLLSVTFTSKFDLVFVLTFENACSKSFLFKANRKCIDSPKKRY